MMQRKTKVYLRERKIASGNIQLYLEYYDSDNVRRMRGIGITLSQGTDRATKRENNDRREKAEAMRAQLQNELEHLSAGKGATCTSLRFTDYMRELKGRYAKISTQRAWNSALDKVLLYTNGSERITFEQITTEWLSDFRDFLVNDCGISANSASEYYNKIIAAVNTAYNEGIIPNNPVRGIKRIKTHEIERIYLTADELKKLIETPCKCSVVKRAFIFGCMTGMRISDIKNLKWEDVIDEDGTYIINLRQQKTFDKTGQIVRITINDTAREQMGEKSKGQIFPAINSAKAKYHLSTWATDAGLTKKITFHSSRHTFATLTLKLTKDIYLTSRMLGHTKISTTEIYAHIVDEERRSAAQGLSDLIK